MDPLENSGNPNAPGPPVSSPQGGFQLMSSPIAASTVRQNTASSVFGQNTAGSTFGENAGGSELGQNMFGNKIVAPLNEPVFNNPFASHKSASTFGGQAEDFRGSTAPGAVRALKFGGHYSEQTQVSKTTSVITQTTVKTSFSETPVGKAIGNPLPEQQLTKPEKKRESSKHPGINASAKNRIRSILSVNRVEDEDEEELKHLQEMKESLLQKMAARKLEKKHRSADSNDGSPGKVTKEDKALYFALPNETLSKTMIKEHFSTFGELYRVYVNPTKNHCIIHFTKHEDAVKAYENGSSIKGCEVRLFWRNVLRSKKKSESVKEMNADGKKLSVKKRLVVDPEVQDELAAMGDLDKYRPLPLPSGAPTIVTNEPVRVVKRTSRKEASKLLKRESAFRKEVPVKEPEQQFEKNNDGETTDVFIEATAGAQELISIMKTCALTLEDRLNILEARDKLIRLGQVKQCDLAYAKKTVGSCRDMCPEKERLLRETRRQVSLYEMDESSKTSRMNPALAVKQYARSSADQEEPLPHELRPLPVMVMTMSYLLHCIADLCDRPGENLAEWYHFLWDRTRSIRKEITQQELCDLESVQLVEQCARFHIHCCARLVAEDVSVFDHRINTENLTKCLQTLKHMYYDLWVKHNQTCPNEPEFMSYFLLLNLTNNFVMWELKQLREDVLQTREIDFVAKMYMAINSNNYVRFFRLVRSASYLTSCLAIRYFYQVRTLALRYHIKALNARAKSISYPLATLIRELAFEDVAQGERFCAHHGLSVDHSQPDTPQVLFSRNTFRIATTVFPASRSLVLVESKRNGSVGQVIAGGVLPPRLFENHVPHDSFDANGFLKPSAWQSVDRGLMPSDLSFGDVTLFKGMDSSATPSEVDDVTHASELPQPIITEHTEERSQPQATAPQITTKPALPDIIASKTNAEAKSQPSSSAFETAGTFIFSQPSQTHPAFGTSTTSTWMSQQNSTTFKAIWRTSLISAANLSTGSPVQSIVTQNRDVEPTSSAPIPLFSKTSVSATAVDLTPSPFRAATTTAFSGAGTAATAFGGAHAGTTTAFGGAGAAITTAFGGAGAAITTAFGGANAGTTTAFGGANAGTTTAFGGANAGTTTAFGGAGAAITTAFGGANACTTTAFGGANAGTTTAFGGANAGTTTAFGGAGTAITTAFGGAKAATTAFGGTSTTSIFGGASSTTNSLDRQTPIFGGTIATSVNFSVGSTTSDNSTSSSIHGSHGGMTCTPAFVTSATFGRNTTTRFAASSSTFGGAVVRQEGKTKVPIAESAAIEKLEEEKRIEALAAAAKGKSEAQEAEEKLCRARLLESHISKKAAEIFDQLMASELRQAAEESLKVAKEAEDKKEKELREKRAIELSETLMTEVLLEELEEIAAEELNLAMEERERAIRKLTAKYFMKWLEKTRLSLTRKRAIENFPAGVTHLSLEEHAERWGSPSLAHIKDFVKQDGFHVRGIPKLSHSWTSLSSLVGKEVMLRYHDQCRQLRWKHSSEVTFKAFLSVTSDVNDRSTRLMEWFVRNPQQLKHGTAFSDSRLGVIRYVTSYQMGADQVVHSSLQLVRGYSAVQRCPELVSGTNAILFSMNLSENIECCLDRLEIILESLADLPAPPLVVVVFGEEVALDALGLKALVSNLGLFKKFQRGSISDYKVLYLKEALDLLTVDNEFKKVLSYVAQKWCPPQQFTVKPLRTVLMGAFDMFFISLKCSVDRSQSNLKSMNDPQILVELCNEFLKYIFAVLLRSRRESDTLCAPELWPNIFKGAYKRFHDHPSYERHLANLLSRIQISKLGKWPPNDPHEFKTWLRSFESIVSQSSEMIDRWCKVSPWPQVLEDMPWIDVFKAFMKRKFQVFDMSELCGTELFVIVGSKRLEKLHNDPWWKHSRRLHMYLSKIEKQEGDTDIIDTTKRKEPKETDRPFKRRCGDDDSLLDRSVPDSDEISQIIEDHQLSLRSQAENDAMDQTDNSALRMSKLEMYIDSLQSRLGIGPYSSAKVGPQPEEVEAPKPPVPVSQEVTQPVVVPDVIDETVLQQKEKQSREDVKSRMKSILEAARSIVAPLQLPSAESKHRQVVRDYLLGRGKGDMDAVKIPLSTLSHSNFVEKSKKEVDQRINRYKRCASPESGGSYSDDASQSDSALGRRSRKRTSSDRSRSSLSDRSPSSVEAYSVISDEEKSNYNSDNNAEESLEYDNGSPEYDDREDCAETVEVIQSSSEGREDFVEGGGEEKEEDFHDDVDEEGEEEFSEDNMIEDNNYTNFPLVGDHHEEEEEMEGCDYKEEEEEEEEEDCVEEDRCGKEENSSDVQEISSDEDVNQQNVEDEDSKGQREYSENCESSSDDDVSEYE